MNGDHAMLIPADQVINFNEVIQVIESTIKAPVVLPRKVFATGKQELYASYDIIGQDYYVAFNTTPDCLGQKFCNIGHFNGRLNAKPEKIIGPFGSTLSKVIKLRNGKKAFFTPSHAGASFFPPILEWQTSGRLFHLSWRINNKNEQKSMLAMADYIK